MGGRDTVVTCMPAHQDVTQCYVKKMMKLSTNYFSTRKTLKYVLRSWRTLTVPDWIITPFDIEIENANTEFSVQDEPVEINVDLDA
ncbi:hypothetical protein T08_13736 [Trichinella sp. T8]|nr:hypothetical protein T08_13736 [Trichinella sp. T8]